MREILFRGKANSEIRDGEWVYGSLLAESENTFPIIARSYDNDEDWLGIDLWDTVEPQTVGQFTGMCDKNDRKIFEGDIIKVGINQRLMYVHWNGESLAWEVTDVGVPDCEVNHLINTFDLAEIQVEAAYGKMISEVIGNIHDNPELLEGGNIDD